MTNTITLEWSDLAKGLPDDYDLHNVSGVYLWGFTISEKFVPYYLGIASRVSLRLHEHVCNIIGGRYTIYHKDSLHNFAAYKHVFKIDDNATEGKIYLPDWPYNFIEFLNRREELKVHIDFMVNTFTYSFAAVEDIHLKEVEKGCFAAIGLQNLANTKGGSNSIKIKHNGDKRVCEKFGDN